MEPFNLPDDVVLQILSFLDSWQLLLARAVCHSWRSLALQPELWRSRCLDDRYDDDGLLVVVLRLAPCARRLNFSSGFVCRERPRLLQLACSTTCAAQALSLTWRYDTADLAATILRNQRALSRMTELELWLIGAHGSFVDLLSETKLVNGLKSLDVFLGFKFGKLTEPTRLAMHLKPWKSALTRLCYASCDEDEPLLFSLVQSQAATLQTVTLDKSCRIVSASILAVMANLRELRCPQLENMTELLRCRGLRRICLDLNTQDTPEGGEGGGSSALAETESFLRHATQITEVTFCFGVWASEFNYFQALAASGVSEVSALNVDSLDNPFFLDSLLRAAPRLPHLRCIELGTSVSVEYLVKLSAAAPSLRVIHFRLKRGDCVHVWMHQPEVESLLLHTPTLHLVILPETPCWQHMCPASTPSCHEGLMSSRIRSSVELSENWSYFGSRGYPARGVGLFGHTAQDVCPSLFDYHQPVDWFHIQ